ncbi:MAG: metallophosphoesterase [Bernardetiaceae bacterium]|nr:metallophosphoesterase [Bernardetiaceae bacterium]
MSHLPHFSRRQFLQGALATAGALVLAPVGAAPRPRLRLAVASDGHFGQEGTDYQAHFTQLVQWLNAEKRKARLDLVVINGDLIHDKPEFMPQAKAYLDKLKMPYFCTRGNHDRLTDQAWADLWGYPTNHALTVKGVGVVLLDTSNLAGEFRCPDLAQMEKLLASQQDHGPIFVFAHIPPHKWAKHSHECAGFDELTARYPVGAVFHGHEHDQDGLHRAGQMPHLFDGHFGGNWGTDYRGYRIVEVAQNGALFTYHSPTK